MLALLNFRGKYSIFIASTCTCDDLAEVLVIEGCPIIRGAEFLEVRYYGNAQTTIIQHVLDGHPPSIKLFRYECTCQTAVLLLPTEET